MVLNSDDMEITTLTFLLPSSECTIQMIVPSPPCQENILSKLRRLIWSLCSSVDIYELWVSHNCGIPKT